MRHVTIQMTRHGYQRVEERAGLHGLSAKHRVEFAAHYGAQAEDLEGLSVELGHHYLRLDGLIFVFRDGPAWIFKTVLFEIKTCGRD